MTVSPSLKKKLLVAFAAAVVAALAWWSWTRFTDSGPGEGFVNGNGRIEATEIALSTRLAGRLQDVLVGEGDFVKAKFLPPVHWRDKLRQHEVFIVVTKDGVVCKQLAEHDATTGNIRLHSFNDLYQDYTINLTDVLELWYYKGFYSRRTLRDVR